MDDEISNLVVHTYTNLYNSCELKESLPSPFIALGTFIIELPPLEGNQLLESQ